uniref:MYND-type domain-containing protein n=1 Tax=Hyaloperonospora arabidopsidis (strain Emoy2) TaxID=559515 RepID=M4BD24_HYAAE
MVGEGEAKRQSFYVVYVPADETKELEEWAVKLPSDKEAQLGCLTKRLRVHFKGNSTIESKQQQEETFKQQLLAQMPEGATLTDEMFQMVLQMDSLVDTIPLVLNTPGVKHVGINMYVDDKGTAKGLATNVRASAIAQACGKRLEVKGDAFIGRVFDNDDDFVRMDFRLSEISGDAPWVQTAKSQAAAAANGHGGAAAGAALARAKAPDKMMLPGSIQRICGADRCSKNGTLRCSRCKAQFYCGAECQKGDWKLHKIGCTK